jgi:hypothetical protein
LYSGAKPNTSFYVSVYKTEVYKIYKRAVDEIRTWPMSVYDQSTIQRMMKYGSISEDQY